VVVAEEQAAGRGRDGRRWHSPPGGVWLALLLRSHGAGGPGGAALGVVSIRAGLVVADVVDQMLGMPAASLKWPNDVLVRDRKLCGILCEGRWQGDRLQWLGVGIGMNVTNEVPTSVRGGAIALGELAPGVRRIDVLDRLVPALRRLATPEARLTEAECAAFATRDWLRDRALRAPVAGRGAGLRPDGALLVATAAGTTAVREGHVELA
jgi:BirA family biotin operon repressor/biotin-[acetyl-CoA-carboxylase] ligase